MPRKVTHARVEPDPNRRLVTTDEAMVKLGGTSRSNLYSLFARGALTPIKLGRRTYVFSDELDRYIASLFAAA